MIRAHSGTPLLRPRQGVPWTPGRSNRHYHIEQWQPGVHAIRVRSLAMPESITPQGNADRNLLFGILALQMDFITRDALIAAMNSWVLDKAKPLGQILVEQGTLTARARDRLEAVVELHLEVHGGDPQKSLAAVS